MPRRFHRARNLISLLFVLFCAAAVPADDGVPPSGLRPVEIPAGPGSLAPALTVAPDGDAIVTWLEPAGNGHALKFAVLADTGVTATGTVAGGRNWFVNWADTPRLFAPAADDWLAHWLVRTGDAPYAYGIRVSRSTDQGRTWSAPAWLHDDDSGTEHGFVSYFREADGRTGAVWLDGRETGGGGPMTLRTASIPHGRTGSAGSERLLDERVCDCCQTASARTDEGPVVVYRDRGEAEIRDISIVRRIDGRWSDPRRVHADGWEIAGCPVNGPAITADGRFVAVAWFTMASGTPRVHVAVSRDAGASFADPATLSPGSALGRVQL
ncbi:MAG: sialidase family protein, partial [Candidatus Wenzhouxiangella sp. M2_3B_020]